MKKRSFRFHVGLRTLKTVAAIVISILIVDQFGVTSSKLIFAMLGAMAAVQPTFKESVNSCLTQIVGVFFGGVIGVLLLAVPIPPLLAVSIGIVLVITLYNALGITYSPSLPCFIVVMLCTTPDIQPMTYAMERIWDTAIGLAVGMLINTLIFPYDNSRQIRATAESLEREVIVFLENMFDGDDQRPDVEKLRKIADNLSGQLRIFENQKLPLRRRRQHRELETFQSCQRKAKILLARMELLYNIPKVGRLTAENQTLLREAGASIPTRTPPETPEEIDVVTNYHVRQILTLRQELLDALQ